MSSRSAVLNLLLILPTIALAAEPPLEWGTFVARSDSSDDALILLALEDADLGTRIDICSSVGRRKDPFAGDIIDAIRSGSGGIDPGLAELLLRTLLDSLFDPSLEEDALRAKAAANAEALSSAIGALASVRDPQLRGALLRILPLRENENGLSVLAAQGADLVRLLRKGAGWLAPGETALLRDFLWAAGVMPSMDLLPLCTQISRLSREGAIVEEARRTAGIIVGPRESHRVDAGSSF